MSEPLETYFHTASLLRTCEPAELMPGVVFLGELPRQYPAPYPPGVFFVEGEGKDGFVPDKMLDDTGVVLDTPDGLVVITGCNHSGLGNLALHLGDLFPGKPVNTVVGGLHLSSADDERLDASSEALREMDAQSVFPMHCSGVRGYEGLKERLGAERVRLITTGDSLDF
jgi:7,8-dihydropterin-6-yl-methyl-4-(beta-D-ribofuranosyl)aminobenzene 5'-phosphate synthase